MASPTELYLPPSFPYPIKVVSLDVKCPHSVERGTRLLSYSFVYTPRSAKPETRFGTWDSAVEGEITSWKVKPGDVISERRAREKPVVLVIEPCKHGVQMGGLCGLCGKDMTDYDYTGPPDASRAPIQMTHSASGPTVSLEEAQKLERETADHLLKSRKLSLIVDLDQTIVHATVDPTVGEWISEGEAWEARRAKKAAARSGTKDDDDDPDSDSDDTSSDDDDECNPNWEALKDVKKFRLDPESFGIPPRSPQNSKGKQIENEGCMYYIKPRPGWRDFLRNTAAKYEMHVYTMGTRAYAEQVCTAIDPDGKIFGGRLLSRDESGSLTQKSLQRLFPFDTSMVVIIDDRADVWEWSPNLIKVIPYDFFIGIGDINSTFLPKVETLASSTPIMGDIGTSAPSIDGLPPTGSVSPTAISISSVSESTLVTSTSSSPPETEESSELSKTAMLTRNSLALSAQLEERPLAKKQEELLEGSGDKPDGESDNAATEKGEVSADANEANTDNQRTEKVTRKALLKNDDAELERVSKFLEEVHNRFYSAYNSRLPEEIVKKRRSRFSSKSHESSGSPYDVTHIIPRLRTETLQGVHILFSSVIPLDTRPEATEIWRMAHMFGAQCYTELTNNVTHVVAAKRGTVKVDAARKRGGIKIVWLAWFTDSIALWRHQDETPYLLDDPPTTVGSTSSPTVDYHQISSDPDPDTDDWDEETNRGCEPQSFELNQINWDDINDEVEAAMNESDDDEDIQSEKSGIRSGNVSEDDWSEGTGSVISSANNTPKLKRKRLRSVTPSENGLNGESDVLRSPLAKRKKLAAERTGYSKLKEAISADDLVGDKEGEANCDKVRSRAASLSPTKEEGMEEGEDEDEEDADDEDDFLARELEEDWG